MSYDFTQPFNLPLLPPNIDLKNPKFHDLLIKARTELAELNGYSFAMPNPLFLISPTVIRESVASSQIENINTTVIDVLQNQLYPESEQKEVNKEVLRYRKAIMQGFNQLKEIPISTRLILNIQKNLIPNQSHQGYRQQANQIVNSLTGEIIYTPPIATQISELIGNLENYINNKNDDIDPLLKCIVTHYQFEAIHPFEDGNGRTGRILMVLQLIQSDLLNLPILYISGYINSNRSEYYRLLKDVTSNQNWEEFIIFLLNGFYLQAKETKENLFKIMSLFSEIKTIIKTNHKKIYSSELVEALFNFPVITPVRLGEILEIHYRTASKYLSELAKANILSQQKLGKYHFYFNTKLTQIVKK